MEVFYLKINRQVDDTKRYLLPWLEAISQFPDSKAYIICDKPDLTNFIKASINFNVLDCEFMESNRNSPELNYIVDNAIAEKWKFAAYAHLTAFLHARDMGYKDFWAIDADDIKLYISPQRIAELLIATKNYANTNKISLFSLDIWTTWHTGFHWSFGVVYTDNSIEWLNIMREHCKDPALFERYGHVDSTINIDWFCTYLRTIKVTKIETFYFENLRMIHDTGNPYVKLLGSIRYWENNKLKFSIFDSDASEIVSLPIPPEMIQLDIGLSADEAMAILKKDINISLFEIEHGVNIPVSIILPISKNSDRVKPSMETFFISLLRQTLIRFQLIIVYNANDFDYTNIFKDVHMHEMFLARLKILRSDSSNIFDMCNEGLRATQGKYVVFANSDDLFLSNFLETLYHLAEQNNADVIYPFNYGISVGDNTARVNSDEKAWDFEEAAYELNNRNIDLRVQGFLNGVFYPRIFNKMIRRDFLINNNINFSTDDDIPEKIFCLKCLCFAKKYMRISQSLYVQLCS